VPTPVQDRIRALLTGADQAELRAALEELQPFDLAELLREREAHEDEQIRLLNAAAPDLAAGALRHLDFQDQYRLLDHLEDQVSQAVLTAMPSDTLSDLIGAVHPRRARELLRRLPDERRAGVQRLLEFPEHTAGGRMTVDYLEAQQNWTAARVLAHFRKVGREVELATYVYVVDSAGRLQGVASMRGVLLSDPQTPISELMYTQVVSVRADADQEEAARLLQQYDFVALPVVEAAGRIVGVITVDDIVDVIEQEATEDIQILGGLQPLEEPYLDSRLARLFRKRIGWLLLLFLAASFTTGILQHHAALLDRAVALAFFIPLLIGTGGNSGAQASTLVIRAMALGEVTLGEFLQVIWREIRMGLALGAAMAVATFALARAVGAPLDLGLTVAATIILIVVVGSVLGAAFPLVGRRFGFDPAVFSAPLITTVVDATGLLIYFQMARLIMGLAS
jgi:magnesium transporter